jgi:hypothetical protein
MEGFRRITGNDVVSEGKGNAIFAFAIKEDGG